MKSTLLIGALIMCFFLALLFSPFIANNNESNSNGYLYAILLQVTLALLIISNLVWSKRLFFISRVDLILLLLILSLTISRLSNELPPIDNEIV